MGRLSASAHGALGPGHEYASRAGTRTLGTLDFAGADGGKNANYLLRWVNPTRDKGPRSETSTATIGA